MRIEAAGTSGAGVGRHGGAADAVTLELFHLPPTRSVRVRWALEELELPYMLRTVEWPPAETVPGYLDLNPCGTLPTLVENGVPMMESMAMVEHLARRHGGSSLVVAPDAPNYDRYLRWLWFGEATLSQQLTNMIKYGPMAPEERRFPLVAEDAIADYLSRLAAIEHLLPDEDYAAGDQFTLADLSLGYGVFIGTIAGLTDRFGTRARRYWDVISARPAFRKALSA